MKLFNVKFSTAIWRYYLMMGIVIVAFFIGYPILALLSLPVFFITLMGVQFTPLRSSRKPKPSAEKITETSAPKPVGSRQHQTAH